MNRILTGFSCYQNCSGFRSRSRAVLRQSASLASAAYCPVTRAEELCVREQNCFAYRVEWAAWGACFLGHSGACGDGTRMRVADCVRSDGSPVPLSFCGYDVRFCCCTVLKTWWTTCDSSKETYLLSGCTGITHPYTERSAVLYSGAMEYITSGCRCLKSSPQSRVTPF